MTDLKLDRSLVAGSEDDRMVGATVGLGRALGLRLVADGVEVRSELQRVRALGCDDAQGNGISRPVQASDVADLLRDWSPRSQSMLAGPRSSSSEAGPSLAGDRASAERRVRRPMGGGPAHVSPFSLAETGT